MNLSTAMKMLGAFFLLGILAPADQPGEMSVLLKAPGQRIINEPGKIIPGFYQYPNRRLILPRYLGPLRKPTPGWAREIIKTRSFASHQSARLYFRDSDLDQSILFQTAGPLAEMRVWPEGTLIILEVYHGDDSLMDGARPVEIAAMAKSTSQEKGSSSIFYSADWSYGLFGPQGEPRLLPQKVEECHQCHSIAFHLTGDLIFTRFPGGRNFPLRKR